MRRGSAPRLLLAAGALALVGASAQPAPAGPGRDLAAEFLAFQRARGASPFDLPMRVETREEGDALRGDVYGVFDHPFETVRDALRDAASWCEVVPLHLNVKACTYRREEGSDLLTLYTGRKFYERPEDAVRSDWRFELRRAGDDFFDVELTAERGPLDTRDYAIRLSAIPLPQGRSFVHLRYAYRAGLVARMAMRGYLATLGRGKVGFSVAATDAAGNPVLVGGRRGATERNAVRYHLAVEAYLDTLDLPAPQRFERRIARWWELSDRYHEQLFELEKGEYLACKRRELADQVRLQRALAEPAAPVGVASILP